jgi:hypothetical protein
MYDEILKDITDGTYKMCRLVMYVDGNKIPKVIIPYNKVSKESDAPGRLTYIKKRFDRGDLVPGKYAIECRVSPSNSALVDAFPFEITDKTPYTISLDKTSNASTPMEQIKLADHIEMVRELEHFRALNQSLQNELDFYKKAYNELKERVTSNPAAGLSENGEHKEPNALDSVGKVLSDVTPVLTGFLSDYFQLQNRKLDVLAENSGKKQQPKKLSYQQQLDRMAALLDMDEAKFNAKMDQLAEEDPDTHDKICEELGLLEDDDQDADQDDQPTEE